MATVPPLLALPAVPTGLATVPELRGSARRAVETYLGRLAPGSQRKVLESLNLLARWLGGGAGGLDAESCPWQLVRYPNSADLRSRLAATFAAATANRHLAALRGVLRECWRLQLMDADSYRRAVDVGSIRGETLPRGRAVLAGELRTLFAHCASDRSVAGRRDAALLAILYGGGLRRAEASALDLEDWEPETGALRVRAGKGNKQRLAYLPAGGRAAVAAWLLVRGPDPGPLLAPLRRKGKAGVGCRLTPSGIADGLAARQREAGVAGFSPHDLRRSFVSDLLDAGADISTVQRLAGHAQVTTTTRYDRRGEETKRQAAQLLHIPYAG